MKKFLFFALFLFLPVLAISGEINKIEPADAAKLLSSTLEKPLVIDVRTAGEFHSGHLPNARNIDLFGQHFEMEIDKLPRQLPILLYCRTGKRSAGAAEKLKKAGFEKILDLNGGILTWQKQGFPIRIEDEETGHTGTDG